MSILHGDSAIAVYVGGVDRTEYLVAESLVLRNALDGDLPTAEFTLEDTSNTLEIPAWAEVRVDVDGVPKWGGYAVRPIPSEGRGGTHRVWRVRAEGYARRFRHTKEIAGTWVNESLSDIIVDMMTQAGLGTEFDGITHVPTVTVSAFSVRDAVFATALDRLCSLEGYTWRVDGNKRIHVESTNTAAFSAPFAVASMGDDTAWIISSDGSTSIIVSNDTNLVALYGVDFVNAFPVNSGIVVDYGDVVINRVIVKGGWQTVGPVAEVFTGDGATTAFKLSRRPLQSVAYVEEGGALKSFGTMWVHSFSQYDTLVDYSDGIVYWPSAPASGTTIKIAYRYMSRVEYEATDSASYASLGFYVTHTVHDPTVTTEDKAAALATSLLSDYADAPMRITFTVERPWLEPGQVINVNFPLFNINGNYLIREVVTRLKRGGIIQQQVTCGGRVVKLGDVMRGALSGYGGTPAVDPYGPGGLNPTITGTTDEQSVSGQILAIDPRTSFTA